MGSLPSAQSALRCWAAFSDYVLHANGNNLPPTAEGLACWIRLFRSANTFANYVGYLRLGCHALGLDTSCSYCPMLQRARQELKKGRGPPRKERFVRETTLVAFVEHAEHEGNQLVAMLHLAADASMLRVPSELQPVVTGKCGDADNPMATGQHSCFSTCGEEVVLKLSKRKNKLHGSTLRRSCWCNSRTASTCPVHGTKAVVGAAANWLYTFRVHVRTTSAQGPEEAPALSASQRCELLLAPWFEAGPRSRHGR